MKWIPYDSRNIPVSPVILKYMRKTSEGKEKEDVTLVAIAAARVRNDQTDPESRQESPKTA